MIYKKRMYQIVGIVFFLAITNADVTPASSDASQNAVKRFNLQDLLGNQGLQVNPGDKQEAHITSPKTQTIDVAELLAAAQKAAANGQQPQVETTPKQEEIVSNFVSEPKKEVDIDVTADKNGNLNLENIPGLGPGAGTAQNPLSINDLTSLFNQKKATSEENSPSAPVQANNVVREEINLGKQKLELEAAGKRATRYTLAKGPDGGLNLIPIVQETGEGRNYEFMQPKEYEERGKSRQQMQMTTLSQALYSPFPSDANILHLHLKGKDGKDGKAGNKGPMGPIGPKGPDGPKGAKGDAGTCSSQINGLFECTPDELDSLSNRVDYLEKICKKVENAAKKHNLIHSKSPSSKTSSAVTSTSPTASTSKSDISSKSEHAKKEEPAPTEHAEKESSSTKEKVASAEPEKVQATKEKESAKEKEDTKEKDVKEEATARIKEKETLKLEKEIEESGVTREKKKEEAAAKEKDTKEEKVKEKASVEEKKDKDVAETKETEKAKEKEDSKDVKEEAVSDDDKSALADKKDTEPTKKLNKDGSPPTERSMIDIKAKLKIAELDLMDRINGAKGKSS